MHNNFFRDCLDRESIEKRLLDLSESKIGIYSVGLYPASLAYNSVMHGSSRNLLLAPRAGRTLFGAFSKESLYKLDQKYLNQMILLSNNKKEGNSLSYTLSDLIKQCEIVILGSNSNHIEKDIEQAIELRESLKRNNVIFVCLVGSFTFDKDKEQPYLLCEKYPQLSFFSGFHRHGALLNPLDSFTANFCHPDPLNALIGSRILDKLSPNIQVSAGVHNLEGQYVKASKNISSIFAGFAHTFHQNNPGLLPTLLTLLQHQCLDQAATVSMSRNKRNCLYENSSLPLTEIGYGVQKIEAALSINGNFTKVRDHTFTQLTALVSDVKGSMMLPVSGSPTRNFQVGQILAELLSKFHRCPKDINELIDWCAEAGLARGALEGINSLGYWPDILQKYSIPFNDSSMINLLYMSIFAPKDIKKQVYLILSDSRELTKYCQQSVRPEDSLRLNSLLNLTEENSHLGLISDLILNNNLEPSQIDNIFTSSSITQDSIKGSFHSSINSYFKNLTT